MSIAGMIAKHGGTAKLERPTNTLDAVGGRTRAWAALQDGVACWAQPAAAQVIEHYANLELVVSHRVYFSQNPSLKAGDRIQYTRGLNAARSMMVIGNANTAEMDRLWVVDVQEVA